MSVAVAAPDILVGAVVFTDIVGFTEYTALRGDADALALLAVQERIVEEALSPGARVVKELGDGLLLWFPDACDAIRTCLDLQARFEYESMESMLPLWVRIGIHWGRPTRRRDDIVGHDVNLASRIVNVAGPGEVLLSEAAVLAANGRLASVAEVEELGPVIMKGIPEPVRLYRAVRV